MVCLPSKLLSDMRSIFQRSTNTTTTTTTTTTHHNYRSSSTHTIFIYVRLGFCLSDCSDLVDFLEQGAGACKGFKYYCNCYTEVRDSQVTTLPLFSVFRELWSVKQAKKCKVSPTYNISITYVVNDECFGQSNNLAVITTIRHLFINHH